MIFVYLKDGRRIDVPEAVSVVRLSEVIFLDADDQVIRQLPREDIIAYGHVLYPEEDDLGSVRPRRHVYRPAQAADPPYLRRRRRRPAPASSGHARHPNGVSDL